MKELYVKFDFNVRVEVDDINDDEAINDQVIEWWVSTTELPDYQVLEEEE